MKLERAIEIQLAELLDHQEAMEPDYLEAMKLGIKAMEAIKIHRQYQVYGRIDLLPGETKD